MWEVADTIPTKEEMLKALEERHGKELQKRFSAATVAVCGLGGLGSNVAVSLARAGIGKLILIDFDRVDITNLHRQQYKASQIGEYKTDALTENLKEIAPYVDGLIHISQIANQRVDNVEDILKVGQEVDVKIIEIDEERERVSLSIRALSEDAEPAEESTEE